MQTAIAMPVLAFLTLAVHSAAAGDWNSLGRVPKDRNVKVHLKSGQKLNGTILQVGDDALQLVPEEGRIRIEAGELATPVEKGQLGHVVQVSTRSGQALTGTLRKADVRSITLVNTSAVRIGRAEIRRVTRRSAGMGALMGLAIGAGGGAVYGAATTNAAQPGEHKRPGRGDSAIEGAGIFGLMGALAGALIGKEMTIYDSASPNQMD
jgi:small nuclear ribonucleoprotein (snRNP)-like protein